uniref:Uncharacterized protein n=1 Tax=Siphoviridae sp. ct5TL29 TaxID=2825336 RepID=A0A8S5PD96_9CAUD|nr:MAG TPA: hypothetical protein [Siphoviridae sp. ct5TL29]
MICHYFLLSSRIKEETMGQQPYLLLLWRS